MQFIDTRHWMIIVFVFAMFILFGSMSIKFGIENFEQGGETSERENEVVSALKKKLSDMEKKEETKTQITDLQDKILSYKNMSRNWQDKYDKLNISYKNINDKLNDTKELLQKEQKISSKNAYLEVPNFECLDCDEIKSFETSFEKCREACNESDSCELINYYSPDKICKLIKNADYKKMGYSSYDMYLKTNNNDIKQFDINKILHS